MPDARRDVTEILRGIDLRDPDAAEELLSLVYDDLRMVAARQLSGERPDHILRPTALVHEAWLRLSGGARVAYESRGHFFRIAARAMRQVLVDEARRHDAAKRGADARAITIDTNLAGEMPAHLQFLELHDALERLEALEPQLGRLVEMRFFTGLTLDEVADALGVSRRKAAKDWAAARTWLREQLAET
ncbi:MAG TPA: ECF-type sigma factor [Gemmatimonadales bacterium]|nr:ECF-type sigma factor [Gemmatimonadales bacterium]